MPDAVMVTLNTVLMLKVNERGTDMKNLKFLYFFLAAIVMWSSLMSNTHARANMFNVKSYGAKGDGKTDDTEAIRAAINAAGAGTRSTVLFPSGTYLYSGTVVADGITLLGQNGATLASDSADAYVRLTGRFGGVKALKFDKVANSFPLNPLILEFAGFFDVSGNEFALGIDPIFRDWDIVVEDSCFDGTIANNTLVAPGGIKLSDSHRITITGNKITGRTNGIYSENCAEIKIINNKFDASTFLAGDAIYLWNENNDLVSNNTSTNFANGVIVKQGAGNQVSGNQLDCPPAGNSIAAIDAFNVRNLTISRNKILRSRLDGIRCDQCGATLAISSNSLMNCGLGASIIRNASVVFAEPKEGENSSIRILDNRYTGSTTGLNYFIECRQSAPPAVVSGNTTNTMLPNRIGP